MKRIDPSWLLEDSPPYGRVAGYAALWWAVVRQAVYDLRWAHESEALDALEFLRTTGEWLCRKLYGVPVKEYREEIVDVLQRRNRAASRELPIGLLSRSSGIPSESSESRASKKKAS